MGIVVHSILVRNNDETYEIMKHVCKQTRGVVTNLFDSSLLTDIILGVSIEGLDRMRIASYVFNNVNSLKMSYDNDEARIRKIADSLREKSIKVKRFNINKINVFMTLEPIQVADIKTAIKFLNLANNPLYSSPCQSHGILCKFEKTNYPEQGLIGEDTDVSLPLKSVNISSEIIDNIGNIELQQNFYNDQLSNITGSFVFPLPFGSSVYSF
jgi:hypothetical protein